MFVTLLCIFLITLSGSVLTYLYSEKDSALLVRLAAGNIVGSVLFGLICFLVACAFGLTVTTVLLSLFISMLPLFLLVKKERREKFIEDFKISPESNLTAYLNAAFYLFFLILFYFFFSRAMFETPQGIFTGGSQNLGDLPFHLGAIFSFTEGQNLPPENPSFAFAKFTYPFMTDFITACFVAIGAKAQSAIIWQNIALAFSLLVLFENFARRLTKNRLAGKLAPVILFFSGGLGFVIFFRDYANDGRPFFEFLWNLPADYTIREKGIRWGNSLTTLFMTQRSLLFGMPITLIVLTYLWKVFNEEGEFLRKGEGEKGREGEGEDFSRDKKALENPDAAIQNPKSKIAPVSPSPLLPFSLSPFLIGLLAGTLPLIHVHSLAVLFVVTAFLFFFRLDKWRVWLAFGLSVAVIAVPELVWAMTGSATRLAEFVDWNIGWDARGDEDVFLFWLKNLGLFIPLLLTALFLIKTDETESGEKQRNKLLLFYLPFLLVFFVSNLVKLAPWQWDNIKVLIYWYIASAPFVAWLLADLWEKNLIFKFIAAACLLILTFSGALDVWRVVSKQINYQVFSRDAVKIAEQIKQKTAPNALFLNAPTYNSAVVLSGRRSLMRYSGHLSSYGIDYVPRENEVKRIYEGTALAETFLKKNNIDYVIISPEERSNLTVNEAFFSKYPVIAEAGAYRVYQIKNNP